MPTCVPIKDMKDTAAFTHTVEASKGPVTVTRNGYDVFVVMRSAEYEALQEELAQSKLLSRIAQAEGEYTRGEYTDGAEFIQSMRESHGL